MRDPADPTRFGLRDANGAFQAPASRDGRLPPDHLGDRRGTGRPGRRLQRAGAGPRSSAVGVQRAAAPGPAGRVRAGLAAGPHRADPGDDAWSATGGAAERPQGAPADDPPSSAYLFGGGDGVSPVAADLQGRVADPDSFRTPATGLEALAEVDDIAIVAMPDTVQFGDDPEGVAAVNAVIEHCQRLRYRMAIVDPPQDSSISQVREFRSQFDTKYARALLPVGAHRRPHPPARPGRPDAHARRCRRRGTSPGSTPAATSSAACTRPPRTRWCSGSTSSSRT